MERNTRMCTSRCWMYVMFFHLMVLYFHLKINIRSRYNLFYLLVDCCSIMTIDIINHAALLFVPMFIIITQSWIHVGCCMDVSQAVRNTLLFVPITVIIATGIDWVIRDYSFLPGVIHYFILGCVASFITNSMCERLITWQLNRNYEKSKKENPVSTNNT